MKKLFVFITNPIHMLEIVIIIVLVSSIIGCDTYKYRYEVASAYAEQLEEILELQGYDTAIGSDEQIEYDAIKH